MSNDNQILLPSLQEGETEPYSLVGRARAKPEMADQLQTRLIDMVAPTRKEPGALEYHVHRDRHDNNLFVFYEVWQSREHLERHLTTPHVQDFLKERHHYLEGDMEIDWLVMQSPYPE
ncbi:putative quinol monooxygenase [Kiloniella antarctica]|uniref:Quinol monooxygenase n=1 Tax=Kiloniella antarctica TaxID=1550907 RepID=A0ABW5BK37_9PROT